MVQKKQRNKMNNTKLYLLLFLIILSIILFANSYSKYIVKEKGNPIVQESNEFYFNSEIVDTVKKEFSKNYWDGNKTKIIEIDIINYLNNLLINSNDITYCISVEIIDNLDDLINDKDLIEIKVLDENNNQILENQELVVSGNDMNLKKYYLQIDSKVELEIGKIFNIKINVTSKEPYEKIMTSNIEIIINDFANSYNLEEATNGEYLTLFLDVNNVEEDIIIHYDNSKVLLDKSSFIVNDVIEITENDMSKIIIDKDKIEKNIYEIYFIKLTEEDITLGNDIMIE